MSEKLARRLEELDLVSVLSSSTTLVPPCRLFPVVEQERSIWSVSLMQMLKRALGETADVSKPAEEDKHSHHSDSVMECRRVPRPTGSPCISFPLSRSFFIFSSAVFPKTLW